ncbi:Kinesin-like protein, partial [Drosera capensis]
EDSMPPINLWCFGRIFSTWFTRVIASVSWIGLSVSVIGIDIGLGLIVIFGWLRNWFVFDLKFGSCFVSDSSIEDLILKLAPQRRSQRHMGGQMQQSNPAAAAALYDQPGGGSLYNTGLANDAGDAVMARWLQSAGLQHLASPMASNNVPNLLMQGYGAQSAEEKQRLFKLMRNLNFSGESGSDAYAPTVPNVSMDSFYPSEFRGDFGAGLLDLHSMDDTELLSEHVMTEPFEPSPSISTLAKSFDDDITDAIQQRESWRGDSDASNGLAFFEKETTAKEKNVAKIKVVVRKRPLNKKELSRKEEDIVTVEENAMTVHEPKVKVDLTAYVEKHEFCFDAVLDEHVTNDEVYRVTIEPIVPIIFQRTKATCFAYGQTGSGKTFTMKPLPLRAAEDLVRLLQQPAYSSQRFKLWLSYFEIYGGKLFDLLCDRKKLCMREDGRQQVCIVGLQEFEVSDVQIVKEYIEKGNATRSTGSTGANEESSRSHAILQLVIKKHSEVKDTRRNNDGNEAKNGKVIGKISFID